MSVLMTAASKKGGLRPKSAKPKPKKKIARAGGGGGSMNGIFGGGAAVAPPAPPMSDESQTVWYWELDGEPMTVIFDKHTSQVWCNGARTEALDGLSDDYNFAGQVVQFGIYAKKTESVHHGCIRRGSLNSPTSTSSSSGIPSCLLPPPAPAYSYSSTTDQLFVNDCLIMEHAYRPYAADCEATGRDLCCASLPPYAFDELPSYEEAILQPLNFMKLEESKKNK